MSRKTGIPSDSMNRSYGVFGRPTLPKPARLPAVGSCQWLPGTSCMAVLLYFGGVVAQYLPRHCERSEAISAAHACASGTGLLRFARNDKCYSFGNSPL